MIDQKALSHAWHVMDHLFQHEDFEREDFEKAIEAYEAAKPDPWRPLSEIDYDKPGRILVWIPVDGMYDRLFIDNVGDNEEDWEEYASRHENERAMFRTIEPPKQDQTKEADHAPTE